MDLLKKIKKEIIQIDFLDELTNNAWIFFSVSSLLFEKISKWLVNYLQINDLERWKWSFIDESTSIVINAPTIIYLVVYILMRIKRINTDKFLTSIHLILFIISIFITKIYIIDFRFIIIYNLITLLIFIFNIYKSISVNRKDLRIKG